MNGGAPRAVPAPRDPDATVLLAVETSCDETAAAVVRGGREVLADVVASQVDLHAAYGGVVPEIACRAHLESVGPVVERALADAGLGWTDLDAVAVTQGPGLVGALLVGLSFAKAAAWAHRLPLVPVNHLEAHLSAAYLEGTPDLPLVGLVVSGGHTALYLSGVRGRYQALGQTLDDAAGEAFDKVAKMLGLGYPGGVAIDRLARQGDPGRFGFPRPLHRSPDLDFSFSGLKTAVRTHLARFPGGPPSGNDLADTCASFQEAVVDSLLAKARRALERTGARTLVVCGGVACNGRLRERAEAMARDLGVTLVVPRPRYCTDNAVMVASAGWFRFHAGVRAGPDLNAVPTWPLERLDG